MTGQVLATRRAVAERAVVRLGAVVHVDSVQRSVRAFLDILACMILELAESRRDRIAPAPREQKEPLIVRNTGCEEGLHGRPRRIVIEAVQ
jgi:hypothetical protein